MHQEDLQLARRLIDGDPHAFRLFIDRYAQRLAAFVMRRAGPDRAHAEDIVQDSLIRATRALSQYRGEASLFTWLCQVCRSELVDQQRKAMRRPQTVSLDAHATVAAAVALRAAPADSSIGEWAAEIGSGPAIMRSLARIPERYAQVLEWKYGDDVSVVEIGRMLAISPAAAQSLMARARDAFREAWKAEIQGVVVHMGDAPAGPERD